MIGAGVASDAKAIQLFGVIVEQALLLKRLNVAGECGWRALFSFIQLLLESFALAKRRREVVETLRSEPERV